MKQFGRQFLKYFFVFTCASMTWVNAVELDVSESVEESDDIQPWSVYLSSDFEFKGFPINPDYTEDYDWDLATNFYFLDAMGVIETEEAVQAPRDPSIKTYELRNSERKLLDFYFYVLNDLAKQTKQKSILNRLAVIKQVLDRFSIVQNRLDDLNAKKTSRLLKKLALAVARSQHLKQKAPHSNRLKTLRIKTFRFVKEFQGLVENQ